jgi:archaemetzincin
MKKTLIFCMLSILLIAACQNENEEQERTSEESQEIESNSDYTLDCLEKLHRRKTVKIYDRTFSAFLKKKPNKPDSIRKYIYILPFGNMKAEIESIVLHEVNYLNCFFQIPVKVLDRVSFDEIKGIENIKTRMMGDIDLDYYSKMKGEIGDLHEQIQASSFMDYYMIKHKPEDAIAVLGITEHDIYNPGYNFLFGSSKLHTGVGIVSTFRIIDYGQTTKHNIRKVMSKQIANMFSIKNVKDYECLLNFHSSKNKLEDGVFYISPKALEKLQYSLGFDHLERFTALKDFWTAEENENMAKYYEECCGLVPCTSETP